MATGLVRVPKGRTVPGLRGPREPLREFEIEVMPGITVVAQPFLERDGVSIEATITTPNGPFKIEAFTDYDTFGKTMQWAKDTNAIPRLTAFMGFTFGSRPLLKR